MAGINKVILIGNLGKDPEVRYLEGGMSVAKFTLATSESFKDKNTGEKRTTTDWHNIVAWRGLAEISEKFLKKGMQIYVEGKLKTRQWQDKDGNTRYTTEVVANNFQMLGKKGDNNSENDAQTSENDTSIQEHSSNEAKNESSSEPKIENNQSPDDDLPF